MATRKRTRAAKQEAEPSKRPHTDADDKEAESSKLLLTNDQPSISWSDYPFIPTAWPLPLSSHPNCFLIKSEPESRLENGVDVKFSIQDLEKNKTTGWEGVRNYEARNIMRDKMKLGDVCLFYHSNCKQPGIVGLAQVVKEAYPDKTAFQSGHPYFDPKSTPSSPRWFQVDVQFVCEFPRCIALKELQELSKLEDERARILRDMTLLKRGRLSVQSVSLLQLKELLKLLIK